MFKNFRSVLIGTLLLISSLASHGIPAKAEEQFLDAIVASVNNTPITLSDVMERIGGPYPASLSEASRDDRIQVALQQLIMEQLLRAESQERRLGVSRDEIDRYIARLAEQNGLSVSQFEEALAREQRNLDQYRQQIEVDILRTKLASALMREGVTVGEQEIDEFIEKRSEFTGGGTKLKLRQIMLEKSRVSEEEALALLEKLRAEIHDVNEFAAAAAKYSHGSEGPDGGALGVLSEEELSGPIFDTLFRLEEGVPSEVVQTGVGYHIFLVEERYVDGEETERTKEALREAARAELERQKVDEKLRLYFVQELSSKFAVDKKI